MKKWSAKKRNFYKNYNIFVLFLITVILLSACSSQGTVSGSDEQEDEGSTPNIFSFATSPNGTAFNSTATGVASVLDSESPFNVIISPYAGSTAFIPLINNGEVQLGLSTVADNSYALQGINDFDESKNIRLLVRGNPTESVGLTVLEDSDLHSVKDLKGKRVASRYTGGITGHITTEMQLEANGLTWDDVTPVPVANSVAAIEELRDGNVDAAFGMSPFTPSVVEAHNAVGLRALNFFDDYSAEEIDGVPQELLDLIDEYQPGSYPITLQAGFIEEETTIIEFSVSIISSTHLSEEAGYTIVKTLWENYEKLHPAYSWLEKWNHDTMFDPNPTVPYHPGAVKFFKEVGLWTDEVEERQQELLELTK